MLAASTADDVARIAFGLGFEFSGDELLRFSGQKVGRVTVSTGAPRGISLRLRAAGQSARRAGQDSELGAIAVTQSRPHDPNLK